MMDWGFSAVIVAVITFICTQVTDSKVKKLNDRIAQLESSTSKLYDDVSGVLPLDRDR